ncbi:hypothetical protein LCGC14_1837220 [marine sediment metagenome]|uniref:Uncharacterized protein n=1 Tax=marine sediment metagenome TaxID=412755 RepID=A0A0F9GEG9_9ZZZZ
MPDPIYILELPSEIEMVPVDTKVPLPPFLQEFVRKYPAWAPILDPDGEENHVR